MVVQTKRAIKPRKFAGSRSPRYEARRQARGVETVLAPSWSDAGAAAVLAGLQHLSTEGSGGLLSAAQRMLQGSTSARKGFIRSLGLSAGERDNACAIVEIHAGRIKGLAGDKAHRRAEHC